MRTLWRGIVGTIFWSYDRGTWPYDVLVVVIVLFVLLTPRSWFHDQPQAAAPAANAAVQMVSQDTAAQTSVYRLDATALPAQERSSKSTPELERATHDVLSRTVDDLKGRTFQVRRIDPALAADGSVLYYEITIHP